MSYVLNGKYYRDGDTTNEENGVQQADTYKAWDHQQQRERHQRDIIQPHKNGKPNPEFIEAYPNEAKAYFSQQELRDSGV